VQLRFKSTTIVLAAIFLFSGIILTRCAKQGTPAGGPKDADPPEFVSADPPNRSVFFDYKKITITFNEFIQLKDASKEIFISPPMRSKPEYKAIGKKVVIEFQEELKTNSTYTISFGNSIVDYTESNPLVNFEYVFSTGSYIDSLSIPGKVVNAFDHKPEPLILVMVYQDDNDTIPLDSLPLKIAPKNASKTTQEGTFRINNLAAGKYKLFALEDYNNNFIFDMPNERIAFLDSLVTISPPPEVIIVPTDSTEIDSVGNDVIETDTIAAASIETDTIGTDTVADPSIQLIKENFYTLYLFEEADTVQRLLDKKLIGTTLLRYIFRLPADSVNIIPVGFQPETPDWYMMEYGKLKDTLNLWLKPGLPDTIRVGITAADSVADTSRYILSKPVLAKSGKRKEAAKSGFAMLSNVKAGALDVNKNLQLRFGVPVASYDTSFFTLYSATDTLIPVFVFTDTVQKLGEVIHSWNQGETYQLIIEDSALCDIGGSCNDSTFVRFRVRSVEDYGLLLLNLILPDSVSGKYIIQLMNDKETLIRQEIVDVSGILRFEYLMAGNYKLKAIFDANENGRWDTGKYGTNSLPEQVEYYPPTLTIRANWEQQEDWQLYTK